MGNVLAMAAICFQSSSSGSSSVVKLVFWEGKTTILKSSPTTTTSSSGSNNNNNNNNNNSNSHHQNKIIAGEIMFQFPDKMICHADSFYIGQTIPALSISDQLHPGQTYFVLPIDLFAFKNLSISSLSLLANTCSQSSNSSTSTNGKPKSPTLNFSQEAPFQYVKGVDGKMLIKVSPEFLLKLILSRGEGGECMGSDDGGSPNGNNSFLCSTPELKKHYDLLVGCTKENVWSPKLETISEAAINKGGRFSPYRLSPYRLIAGGSPYRLQA